MTVTFTLTVGSASTDAGPFNISGTTSGGALNDVSIATGVTKQQLLSGHTVTNINDTITGGTIASTGTCTTTDTWSVTPSPTPTATEIPCLCYCYTFTTVPGDLSARWRNCTTGNVDTELINNLEIMDNGNGTYTACLCVRQGSSYSTPVCVQGGIEVTCPDTWVSGASCDGTAGVCFIN